MIGMLHALGGNFSDTYIPTYVGSCICVNLNYSGHSVQRPCPLMWPNMFEAYSYYKFS